MIIGICGLSRSGKDTSADTLVDKHHFVRVAFADPMKRFCMEIFGFTEDQLWGDKKNEPDTRYRRGPYYHLIVNSRSVNDPLYDEPRRCGSCGRSGPAPSGPDGECFHYLTPRHALQQLGTEWARSCYRDVWMEYTVRVANELLGHQGLMYRRTEGVISDTEQTPQGEFRNDDAPSRIDGVVIPDARYKNELDGIRRAGGKVVRVKRPSVDKPEFRHSSETEQMSIPDEYFDYILDNSGDLHYLELQVDRMLDVFKGNIREYDQAQANVPPYQRK